MWGFGEYPGSDEGLGRPWPGLGSCGGVAHTLTALPGLSARPRSGPRFQWSWLRCSWPVGRQPGRFPDLRLMCLGTSFGNAGSQEAALLGVSYRTREMKAQYKKGQGTPNHMKKSSVREGSTEARRKGEKG